MAFQIKKGGIGNHINQIWGWNEAEQFQFHLEEIATLREEFLYANETLIGYLQTKEDEKKLFIWGVYLLSNYQSVGYGTELFRQLGCYCQKNAKVLELEVFKINLKAIRFYERLGFKKVTETEHHFQYQK